MGDAVIAALFVEPDGCYQGLPGVDLWDKSRDARNYSGPWPVVAHPPCNLWGKMAPVNWARYGGDHNRPGNDGGCFRHALNCVMRWGGVLEHPASTEAWAAHHIPRPDHGCWSSCLMPDGIAWVTEVWQSAYGHKARKKTWLLYCGSEQPENLDWDQPESDFQIGYTDYTRETNKPTVSKAEAIATPPRFRDMLIRLAQSCNGVTNV